MLPLLTAAAALVPSLLLMWYFHSRDVFVEPPRVLWRVFGLGVLIVFPVPLVAWPVGLALEGLASPLTHGFATAFLEAAIPEECLKFAVLWGYALRRKEFDEPIDGVVYGVAASLGFATFENLLYVAEGGLGVAVLRAFTAVPSHAFAGALMGYYAGRAALTTAGRGPLLAKAIAVPTLLHGLYDFPLLAVQRVASSGGRPDPLLAGLVVLAPAVVVLQWIWTLRVTRRLRSEQLRLVRQTEPGKEGPGAALPGRARSVALTLAGAILAGGGALMALALVLAVVSGEVPREDLGWAVAAGALFALGPAAAGSACFAAGIRRLNQRGRLATPAARSLDDPRPEPSRTGPLEPSS